MRLLYMSASYVPSSRASSIQVMKMCEALARSADSVTLVTKDNADRTLEAASDHSFYGVEANFEIKKLPRPTLRGGGLINATAVAKYLQTHRKQYDLAYCRDIVAASIASSLGWRVAFESHGMPDGRLASKLLRYVVNRPGFRSHVAISQALADDLRGGGFTKVPICVAHDATDAPDVELPRRELQSRPTIGYIGSLYSGRGIETMVALAERMPDCDFRIIGGSAEACDEWRKKTGENIEFLGFIPHSEVKKHYRDLDLVLMPHAKNAVLGATGRSDISKWTSPLKMFEYMASGVPLIASDLPVLQEVLRHEHNALIAASGDIQDWESKLRLALSSPELRTRLVENALQDVREHYTWDTRAKRILATLN